MPEPLLDRVFLEKLERLTIHWQKSFAGLVGGHNPSRFPGGGQEFLDHRHFHHGDDLRSVNWRAYLRLDKLFLKMFQVEPRVPVQILIDASDSMALADPAKFLYARRLAAALTYVGLVRLDTMSIAAFGSRLGEAKRCGGGRHRFSPVLDYLTALPNMGRTDFHGAVRELLAGRSQPGLLIIISDFLDDAGAEKPLQYLADFGHELSLVQVFTDEDRTPPWLGELDLEDAETGQTLRIDVDRESREQYTRAFDAFSNGLSQLAYRNGGRYIAAPTSRSLEDVLFDSMVRTGALT